MNFLFTVGVINSSEVKQLYQYTDILNEDCSRGAIYVNIVMETTHATQTTRTT